MSNYDYKRLPHLDRPGWACFEINGHRYHVPTEPLMFPDKVKLADEETLGDDIKAWRVQQRYALEYANGGVVRQESTPIYDALKEEFELERMRKAPWAVELKRQKEAGEWQYPEGRRYPWGRDNY